MDKEILESIKNTVSYLKQYGVETMFVLEGVPDPSTNLPIRSMESIEFLVDNGLDEYLIEVFGYDRDKYNLYKEYIGREPICMGYSKSKKRQCRNILYSWYEVTPNNIDITDFYCKKHKHQAKQHIGFYERG